MTCSREAYVKDIEVLLAAQHEHRIPLLISSAGGEGTNLLFLRDGRAEQRERFLEGLSWLDGYAIREHGHPFLRCAPADQTAMLHSLDQGAGPGHNFFRFVKSATARIYYNTQIGYQELNKGGRVPASFGCKHAGHA